MDDTLKILMQLVGQGWTIALRPNVTQYGTAYAYIELRHPQASHAIRKPFWIADRDTFEQAVASLPMLVLMMQSMTSAQDEGKEPDDSPPPPPPTE